MNKEIELLNKKIEAQDKIINEQALEIARLKEGIDKAIDFINEWKKYTKEKRPLKVSMLDLLYIKEILGDKENVKN